MSTLLSEKISNVRTTVIKSKMTASEARKVIIASSLGTLFEWYDFFIYGSLAAYFSSLFFPKGNETAAFLASLAAFGAGFAVRPIGALIFGAIGDRAGRKTSFLITIILMGASTAALGFLPTFSTWGWASPVALVSLRLLQGLALGGEYGGAATYVAEHAPSGRRGTWTSWIQATATLGLLASLIVVLACRLLLSAEQFADWGWRIPFIISIGLLLVSIYVRARVDESPVFRAMQREGRLSSRPVSETLRDPVNLKRIAIMLFGTQAGLAAVWYTCQFYALFFLVSTMKMPFVPAYGCVATALVISTPMFVFFGWLSDRIGRKWIVLTSFALAALTLFPIFGKMAEYANPGLTEFQRKTSVQISGNDCNFNLFATPTTPCDLARDFLAKAGLSYAMQPPAPGVDVIVRIGDRELRGFDAGRLKQELDASGYPQQGAANPDVIPLTALLVLMMVYVTMAYAPMAAYFVELFPARIRYTSMSITYHIGVGWLGGFSPFICAALVIHAGNILSGLWYPVILAALSFFIGALFIRETVDSDIA